MSKYIQKIPLLFNATDRQYGELYQGLSLSFIKCWKEKWVPSRDAYLRSGIKRPEHAHWNWASKSFNVIMNQREDAVFEITVASDTQGVMLLSESTSVFCDDMNNKNIHVDFLEVAPWNYFKDCKRGYFKGVGSALLLTAIQFSMECGFDGRISLESLPQSESFYARRGMIPVKNEKTPDPLKYFELTTQAARGVLKGLAK